MNVYLAYYHDGFTDDHPELLEICATEEIAQKVIDNHNKNGDRSFEYRGHASWWIDEKEILMEN